MLENLNLLNIIKNWVHMGCCNGSEDSYGRPNEVVI